MTALLRWFSEALRVAFLICVGCMIFGPGIVAIVDIGCSFWSGAQCTSVPWFENGYWRAALATLSLLTMPVLVISATVA